MNSYRSDWLFWFFVSTAGLCAIVSVPATFALVQPFHDSKTGAGWLLAVAVLIVLEIGAIGCKVGSTTAPEWRGRLNALCIAFLVLTTAGNYMHGADLFARATDLPPALSAVKTAQAGWALALLLAGLVPLLLFVFMTLAIARYKRLAQGTPSAPMQPSVPPVIQIDMTPLITELRALAAPALIAPRVDYPQPQLVNTDQSASNSVNTNPLADRTCRHCGTGGLTQVDLMAHGRARKKHGACA